MISDWLTAKKPLIIAHRGASADAPENTLEAFSLAMAQGADGFEFDVQLTSDGIPVILHDHLVERTTDGVGSVADLTFAELRKFKTLNGEPVPTLDEVFRLLGEKPLYNIEIKDFNLRDIGLETAVAQQIRAFNLEHRVLLSSFNALSLRRARRILENDVPIALLHFLGRNLCSYLVTDAEADHPFSQTVNNKYMTWARKRGYRVHVWTVDDPVEAQRLTKLGVHAVVTNRPQFIREHLTLT